MRSNGRRTSIRKTNLIGERTVTATKRNKKNKVKSVRNAETKIVGATSSIPLSKRFEWLHQHQNHGASKTPPATVTVVSKKKNSKNKGNQPTNRAYVNQLKQKARWETTQKKRHQVVNARRKGLEKIQMKEAPSQTQSSKKKKKNSNPKSNTHGEKNASNGKSTQGKKKVAPKPKEITGEDLDMEMDQYWHDAGKGPDPQAARLDRQLEEYWASKPKDLVRKTDGAAKKSKQAEESPASSEK